MTCELGGCSLRLFANLKTGEDYLSLVNLERRLNAAGQHVSTSRKYLEHAVVMDAVLSQPM